MGHSLSTADLQHCLLMEIEASKGAKTERVLLFPLTSLTVPKIQSPLLRILYEAECENASRQWAWPPVSCVEDANGPTDIRCDALYSGLNRSLSIEPLPTVKQCYDHAVPKEKRHTPTYSRRYGHVFSLLAVVVPESVALPPHRNSWIPFTPALAEALLLSKAQAVGLYRYHQFQVQSNSLSGSFVGNPFDAQSIIAGANPSSLEGSFSGVPTEFQERQSRVSAVDYYLFRDFCYEAKATVLFQSVMHFLENYPQTLATQPTVRSQHTPYSGYTLLRCRAANLPQVRLMQKLYRLHISGQAATFGEDGVSLFRYGDNDEILHCKINGVAREAVRKALVASVRMVDGRCCVNRDCVMAQGVPTPFDGVIAQWKDHWTTENVPVKTLPPSELPQLAFRESGSPRDSVLLSSSAASQQSNSGSSTPTPIGVQDTQFNVENASFAGGCCEAGLENVSFAVPSQTVQSSQGPSLVASFTSPPPDHSFSLRRSMSPQPEEVSAATAFSPAATLNEASLTCILSTVSVKPAAGLGKALPMRSSSKPVLHALDDPTVYVPQATTVLVSHGDGEWHEALWRNESHPTYLFKFDEANGWGLLVAYGDLLLWDSQKHPTVMPSLPYGRPTYVAVDPRAAIRCSDPHGSVLPCLEIFELWERSR